MEQKSDYFIDFSLQAKERYEAKVVSDSLMIDPQGRSHELHFGLANLITINKSLLTYTPTTYTYRMFYQWNCTTIKLNETSKKC